jgi:hypothetical protein
MLHKFICYTNHSHILIQGEYWFSNTGKGDTPEKYNAGSSSEPVRKSQRVPKRRSLDSDIDQDHETRYLEKSRVSKTMAQPTEFEDTLDEGFKKRKVSKVISNNNSNGNIRSGMRTSNYELDEDFVVSRMGRDGTNHRRHKNIEQNGGFIEGEEVGSDGGLDAKLTTRQRAMQGKGGSGNSLIEFPNGLPPAPSRSKCTSLASFLLRCLKHGFLFIFKHLFSDLRAEITLPIILNYCPVLNFQFTFLVCHESFVNNA